MNKYRCSWTAEEDQKLINLMQDFAANKWCVISQNIGTRTAVQCMNRWTKILKPGLQKGYWSKEEDTQLLNWIEENGPKKWSECSKFLKKRSAKQCRERWLNNLDPRINRDQWTEEEDKKIYELYKKYGTSWSKVSKEMIGRTENSIKNRFYSSVRSLISNEDLLQVSKEKKKINKNQGFFNVLKEKKDEETKKSLNEIKRKMLSHCSIRDSITKKKKAPNDFYENLYRRNFEPEEIEKIETLPIKKEEREEKIEKNQNGLSLLSDRDREIINFHESMIHHSNLLNIANMMKNTKYLEGLNVCTKIESGEIDRGEAFLKEMKDAFFLQNMEVYKTYLMNSLNKSFEITKN